MTEIINKLHTTGDLTDSELEALIGTEDAAAVELLRKLADKVFLRGLIEISSYCKNDCLYCGIRRSNKEAERYRLLPEDIIACADEGYRLGFRTFVMQGGEDSFFRGIPTAPLLSLSGSAARRATGCCVKRELTDTS